MVKVGSSLTSPDYYFPEFGNKAARLCGVSLNTVLRFTARFGKHAERFHDHMVRGVQPRQIQPDEAWAFVGKKRQEL